MKLADLITEQIREQGPMNIADYMEMALAHPEYGYYMRKDPLGREGDFTTAPEISQIFGELFGAWLAGQWLHLGKPACHLIEFGPGRGTLMSDILRATKHISEFHDAINIHLVETSPTLKQKQWNTLAGKHSRIEWHDTIDDLPKDKPWLVVANEFFDALPIRQFIHKEKQWHERHIGLATDDELEFTDILHESGDDSDALETFLTTYEQTNLEDGDIVEFCHPAIHIMSNIAAHVEDKGGVALIADYGYVGGGIGDTLQAVRTHRYQPVLRDPGAADLTAHVDFSQLATIAQKSGASIHGPVPQGAFLGRLGAIPRAVKLCEVSLPEQQAEILGALRRLLDPDQMGELFKVMALSSGTHPTPEGFGNVDV